MKLFLWKKAGGKSAGGSCPHARVPKHRLLEVGKYTQVELGRINWLAI